MERYLQNLQTDKIDNLQNKDRGKNTPDSGEK
jgi:hypothetical protein